MLVLDEADRMLDMGFWPDVRRIVSTLPVNRQTLLFSATMSDEVTRSAAQIMRDPKLVQIGRTGGLATTITHEAHVVPSSGEKVHWLTDFLRKTHEPTIVFVRTKILADRLGRRLADGRIRLATLHADRSQEQRLAAVEGFKSGRHKVLVATDIAARGLDIDSIGYVINYEVPGSVDTYVHRVGRTGRAEATGHAVTLASLEEVPALRALEKALKLQLINPEELAAAQNAAARIIAKRTANRIIASRTLALAQWRARGTASRVDERRVAEWRSGASTSHASEAQPVEEPVEVAAELPN